jgi:hypothetical protein
MAETQTKSIKGQDAERTQEKKRQLEPAPMPMKVLADESIPFPGLLGDSAVEFSIERHAALLGDPHFLHSVNHTQKARMVTTLQGTYGNQYVQRLVQSMPVQAKLAVDSPDDQYEKEADTVADTVTIASATSIRRQESEEEEPEEEEEEEPIQTKLTNDIQAQRQAEEQEEEETIQTKLTGSKLQMVSEELESRIKTARGRGQPLADPVRTSMESQFGRDFGQVHIHTDADANNLSRQLGAKAFTTGSDIFFREGAYQPSSDSGKRLIAHELTHVVQQSQVDSKSIQWLYMQATPAIPPKKVPKKKAAIEYHVITKDPVLAAVGGIVHDDLEKFMESIMRRREKDSSHWTLWFAMHGWEDVVAYDEVCTITKDCLTKDRLARVFSGKEWETWRSKYGPWKVLLLSCYLTDGAAKALEGLLKRPGAPSTASGKSTRCDTEISKRSISLEVKGEEIRPKNRKEYKDLSRVDKKVFIEALRKLKPEGYCSVDTRQMKDEVLLHYYFAEPPEGEWIKCTITVQLHGKATKVPLYEYYTPGSPYQAQCHPLRWRPHIPQLPPLSE